MQVQFLKDIMAHAPSVESLLSRADARLRARTHPVGVCLATMINHGAPERKPSSVVVGGSVHCCAAPDPAALVAS